jgi:predicted RNA binding protein YcfA (HicA-like mRNA interferase family)
VKYKEIAKKLKKMGCQEIPRRGGGSHRKWHNPVNNAVVPIPDWGNKDLKIGTLRQIIRQFDLDWEEFKNM